MSYKQASISTKIMNAKSLEDLGALRRSADTFKGANTKTRRRIEASYLAAKKRLEDAQPKEADAK